MLTISCSFSSMIVIITKRLQCYEGLQNFHCSQPLWEWVSKHTGNMYFCDIVSDRIAVKMKPYERSARVKHGLSGRSNFSHYARNLNIFVNILKLYSCKDIFTNRVWVFVVIHWLFCFYFTNCLLLQKYMKQNHRCLQSCKISHDTFWN